MNHAGRTATVSLLVWHSGGFHGGLLVGGSWVFFIRPAALNVNLINSENNEQLTHCSKSEAVEYQLRNLTQLHKLFQLR